MRKPIAHSHILPRPRVVKPAHPKTWPALNAALQLGVLLEPNCDNDRQVQAQEAIREACRSGDLPRTMEAVAAARRWDISTREWRAWADDWVARCKRLILDDVREMAA